MDLYLKKSNYEEANLFCHIVLSFNGILFY